MEPRPKSFEDDIGNLLGRLAELSPAPPDAASVALALRRRGVKRKALGCVAAAAAGLIVTAWALYVARPAPQARPASQVAAVAEQPAQPRPGHGEMPTLSFQSVAMPAFDAGQKFKFETGPVSIPAALKSEGPRLAVAYSVPSVSMPKL
jgi:hypothetical protein